ncbi:unnamed protein product [Spirodela intermedia]|uniref:NAC domain-containing protein n=1 Tax=Spirodela intermedia TaxID=51605 RepID=A0A7I8IB03_SPIIN|nr:unnamed protein product [Spirodela intermedia]CAA6654523.1 unnamed protein product [Spirodela intermedia]
MGDNLMDLPPGFRFHPTDEEIITHYLRKKVVNKTFSSIAIGEADLNRCEPWNLPSKAKMGEKEWYFFCKRDKKYPTGTRTNRATESGYWKATGKDKEIFYRGKSSLVGMKKTLVFYLGRAPKGQKTNWVMHEYRLEGKFSGYDPPGTSNDEWVICRVFHKSTGPKTRPSPELERTDSFGALLSSADDRFTYNGDGMAVKASSTAMLNPSYLASTMPMEYPRDPQRSFFTNNNGELCSGFPSQEAILSLKEPSAFLASYPPRRPTPATCTRTGISAFLLKRQQLHSGVTPRWNNTLIPLS